MIGVVADDVTGANDIAIMFANGGCTVDVYAYDAPLAFPYGKPDVLVLDTNSRLDSPEKAYRKVQTATRRLKELGCTLYFNKTCSVFRGNIGAEFDAMLDELGRELAVVILGFPKNGRQTLQGMHYVHGVPLSESEFRNDPIHPMRTSNLVEILSGQTKRKVGLIEHQVVEAGWESLRETIEAMAADHNYLIVDVKDQASLATIAQAVEDRYVLCGSSALGEELPPVLGIASGKDARLPLPEYDGVGIMCAAGSLMPQTKAQIAYAGANGIILYELNSLQVLTEGAEAVAKSLSKEVTAKLLARSDVLVHSSHDPEVVKATKELGARQGLSDGEVGRIISDAIAEVAARCLEVTKQRRILVAGGETSAAVCSRLGIVGMRVWREIQPGLPSCFSLEENPRLLVLKSGSFGQPNFIVEAVAHLKEQ